MGFILVPKQVDVSNPSKKCEYITGEPKIPLKTGTHLIGREKFLHCDDKRMSRQHAKLEVTNDLVTFIGLHRNPCFYLQNGGKIQILEQSKAVHLQSGDMFGLLPNKCWYEVIHVPDDITPDQTLSRTTQDSDTQTDDSNKTAMLDSTEVNNDDDDVKALKLLCDAETRLPDSDEGQPSSPNIGDESQSLLQDALSTLSESLVSNNQATENNTSEQITPVKVKTEKAEPVQPSLLKRPLLDTSEVKTEPSDDVAKKIKTEPDSAVPGSSNGQNGSDAPALPPSDGATAADGAASSSDGAPAANMPPSPAKPRVRERCMYGANCYRKNPLHKAEFSHPSDADWGAGERGECPYGARCERRHPRHWHTHSHPPGTVPPDQRQQPQGKNQARKENKSTQVSEPEEESSDEETSDEEYRSEDEDDESVSIEYTEEDIDNGILDVSDDDDEDEEDEEEEEEEDDEEEEEDEESDESPPPPPPAKKKSPRLLPEKACHLCDHK